MEEDKKHLITTIIPTYRRPNFLKRAILSVVNQTYPYFKICVYDNASGDKTAEVVKELAQKDSRIHYFSHAQNISVKNFNFGLSRVDTSYFSLLSDDDVLLPDFYKKALEGFKKYPEAMFSATQTIIVNEKDRKIKSVSFDSCDKEFYKPPEGLVKMSEGILGTWTGILFRKEAIESVGLLDEEVEGPIDTDFLLRIISIFPFIVLKIPGAIFSVNEFSSCSTASEVDFLKGYKRILEKIRDNERILSSTREIVYKNLKEGIGNTIWRGGLKDITKRKFSQSKQSAESLKNDFQQNVKSDILHCGTRLCEFSSIFYYFFATLNKIRKLINVKKRTREKNFQKLYGVYLKYLERIP